MFHLFKTCALSTTQMQKLKFGNENKSKNKINVIETKSHTKKRKRAWKTDRCSEVPSGLFERKLGGCGGTGGQEVGAGSDAFLGFTPLKYGCYSSVPNPRGATLTQTHMRTQTQAHSEKEKNVQKKRRRGATSKKNSFFQRNNKLTG